MKTRLVVLCAIIGSACARMQTPPPVTDSPKGRSRGGGAGMIAGAVLGGSAVAGGIAYAGVTLARRSKSRSQSEAEPAAPATDSSSTATASAGTGTASKQSASASKQSAGTEASSKQSGGGVGVQSKLAGVDDDMTFSLSPERLTVISELNSRLEPLADHLATVPIFTVTLGGRTSPLTVPGPDGQKLAYFFFEAADAAAFLRAVVEQTGMKMEAGVVGLRLSEVVRAYGSETAAAAKETFVLIPMMSEVAMARKLVKQRELALEAAGRPVPERDDDTLDATNGLVPVFWSESLAVQTAAGKRRKLLFFREADLQMMWANLTATRQQAAQAEGDEAVAAAAALPTYPTVQVSDLQTVSLAMVEANATEAFVFRPSSMALLDVQRGVNPSEAEAGGMRKPAGQMGIRPPAAGAAAGAVPGYEAPEAPAEDVTSYDYEPEPEEEEED